MSEKNLSKQLSKKAEKMEVPQNKAQKAKPFTDEC